MIQNRALKFRLHLSNEQRNKIDKTLGACRYVYNHMLFRNKKVYERRGEHLSYYDMQNLLPKMKEYLPWLKDVDSKALQYTCRQVDNAYQRFFKEKKGYPKPKRRKDNIQSYSTTQIASISYSPHKVKLPKLGWIRHSDNRGLPEGAKIFQASVSRKNGKYYVSILYKYEKDVKPITINENQVIGLDYKSDGLYIDSNGYEVHMPHFFRESQDKLAKEQRRLSRKKGSKKGEKKSNRYLRQQAKVAKIHEHIANQRMDWLHKESTRLANEYDAVCVEDIDMQSISQELKLGKATTDNGFGMFRDMLKYKLEERGKRLVKIDKWFPSSKLCSDCGWKFDDLTLDIREWNCPNCGTHHDRDLNAAVNIRNEGLRMLIA